MSLTSVPRPEHFDDGEFYGDAWARLAEAFYFNEMDTSASSPEHQIVNVNIITENNPVPDYNKLANGGPEHPQLAGDQPTGAVQRLCERGPGPGACWSWMRVRTTSRMCCSIY